MTRNPRDGRKEEEEAGEEGMPLELALEARSHLSVPQEGAEGVRTGAQKRRAPVCHWCAQEGSVRTCVPAHARGSSHAWGGAAGSSGLCVRVAACARIVVGWGLLNGPFSQKCK